MTEAAQARMAGGAWYSCLEDPYEDMRARARRAGHQHSTMEPVARGSCGPRLAGLFAALDPDAWIEAPFHCSYGINTTIGAAYLNAGCMILDSARVSIGDHSMLGPGVHIYCADHHGDAGKRREGIERSLPVTIGRDVWIGGGAILLPGVTVGDRAIVAAGAVVSRDVAPDARVAGVPARAL